MALFGYGSEDPIPDEESESDAAPPALQIGYEDVPEGFPSAQKHQLTLQVDDHMRIKYLDPEHVLHWMDTFEGAKGEIMDTIRNNLDVKPGVYEGEAGRVVGVGSHLHGIGKTRRGFKVWECAHDLVKYLHSLKLPWKGKKVLEIGCGQSLPGLYALLNGAVVHFQDYNAEVIMYVTIPNVNLNVGTPESKASCSFYAGDWSSLLHTFRYSQDADTHKYDYILASETIYNVETYWKIANLIKFALKPEGTMYLAAKVCYFGVGGSTYEFQEVLQKRGGLDCTVCFEHKQGVRREILKITRKQDGSLTI